MDTYLKQWAITSSERFAELIVDEEARGRGQFEGNFVCALEGVLTNLVCFSELPPGERPGRDVQLNNLDGPLPAGATLVWCGVVLVDRVTRGIRIYRPKPARAATS